MRIVLALAVALMACSSQAGQGASAAQPAADPARHPVSGLEVIPLTISQNGKVHKFRVEVAATFQQQQQGLMFRTEMGKDEGMIFPHDPPRASSFWMKNTVIPLDIIFIGTDNRITNVAANAEPYTLDPRRSDGLTNAVLELNGGRLAELGFTTGAKVEW